MFALLRENTSGAIIIHDFPESIKSFDRNYRQANFEPTKFAFAYIVSKFSENASANTFRMPSPWMTIGKTKASDK